MTETSKPIAENSPAEPMAESSEENADSRPGDESTPAALQAEANRYKDLYLRGQADLENFRKRTAREKQDAIRYANTSLLESLLPILDNFELGLDAARQGGDAEGIVQGMSMVRKQLTDFLAAHGVEVIEAAGSMFDPNLHDAIGHEASDAHPEGAVLRQLRRGYKLKDRLLRPATVVVSKGTSQDQGTTE